MQKPCAGMQKTYSGMQKPCLACKNHVLSGKNHILACKNNVWHAKTMYWHAHGLPDGFTGRTVLASPAWQGHAKGRESTDLRMGHRNVRSHRESMEALRTLRGMNRGMNIAQSPETAPPGPYLGDESHRSSRAVYRDSLYRESLYRASLYRDSLYTESLYSESLYRDSLYRDSLYRESAPLQ